MNVRRPRFTLSQIFVLTFAGVGGVVAALFYGLVASSERSLVQRSELLREAAGTRIEARIRHDLGEAADVLADVERAVRTEAIDTNVRSSSEVTLFELLLAHPNVADIAFTHPDRWQLSVFRAADGPKSAIITRTVWREGDGFVAELRTRAADATLHDGVVAREGAVDPTTHLTYETTVSAGIYERFALAPGRTDLDALWRDLGVTRDGESVTFDDRAPRARARRAIIDGTPAVAAP